MLTTIEIFENKPSILQNIELNETVDLNILNQLIKSNLLQITNIQKLGYKFENEKHQLEEIAKRVKNNKLTVQYKKPKYNFGRVFPQKGLSLGSIRKPIRHTLCLNTYTDLDIENCHPQLLKQICEKNNIPINYLKQYVDNRPQILAETQAYYNVQRDDAKNLFIRLAYFGSFDNWVNDVNAELKPPTEFITNYIKELNHIGTLVQNANKDLNKVVKLSNKENEKASVVSIFLQDKERQVLELVYEYLVNNKYIVSKNAILCFDGLMIETINYKPIVLIELHDHILRTSGFDLIFTTKALDKHLINELANQQIPVNPNSFEYMAEEFERTHCKIINQGVYIKETENQISFISEKKLREAYKHKSFKNANGQKENFINHWISNNDNIRAYEDMALFPNASKCPQGIYNLWIPFEGHSFTGPYEKNDKGFEMIMKLIKVLCANEPAVYNYILEWIGQMIQFPEIKTIVPTFISKQGSGKSTLIKILCKLLGQLKVLETTNPERDVWGQFNSVMMDTFLINLNELSKKDTLEAEGKIKGLVTDPTITINKKGVDQIQIKSFHRFIITTNKDDPITTSKDDRRNLIIRSSDELIGNKEFFNTIYELLEDTNVIRTCFDYFLNMPNLDKFNSLKIPQTAYQNELKKLDMTPPEQFLVSLCDTYSDRSQIELNSKEFFEKFQTFISESNINYETTSLKLGVKLANLKIGGLSKGSRTKHGMTYLLNIQDLKKHFQLSDDDVFIEEIPIVNKVESTYVDKKVIIEPQPTNNHLDDNILDSDDDDIMIFKCAKRKLTKRPVKK